MPHGAMGEAPNFDQVVEDRRWGEAEPEFIGISKWKSKAGQSKQFRTA